MIIDGIFITRTKVSQFGCFLKTFKLMYCWEVRVNKTLYKIELRFSILRLRYQLFINDFSVDKKICLLPQSVDFSFQLLGESFIITWVSAYGKGFVLQETEAIRPNDQFYIIAQLDQTTPLC